MLCYLNISKSLMGLYMSIYTWLTFWFGNSIPLCVVSSPPNSWRKIQQRNSTHDVEGCEDGGIKQLWIWTHQTNELDEKSTNCLSFVILLNPTFLWTITWDRLRVPRALCYYHTF